MNRNTLTTLGALRVGDRFHYLKRVDVWQVTSQTRTHTSVNLPGLNGFVHKFDELKKASTQVVFLRHTIPQPGEQCLLRDLNPGDVFHLKDDIISEYMLNEKADFKHISISGLKHGPQAAACFPLELDPNDTVIFVRTA